MGSDLQNLITRGETSPFYKLLGMKIEKVNEKHARLSLNVDKKHLQFSNQVHGGVIASLADSAAAWAIYGGSKMEGVPVTVEMKINFLKPVTSGKIIAEARNIHKGSKIFVSDVEVKNRKDEVIAKSLVTYYLVEKKSHT